jgi:hypothetical protein
MAFTKITNAELNSRGATTLPNVPTIGATALKQEFDAPAKNIVAPKVNNLIDELQASTAAADLGAVAPTGRAGTSVQSVLNSLSSDLGNAEAQSHAHPNKAVIDKFADDGTGLTYDGNPIRGAVESVNGKDGTVVLTASDVGALPNTTPIPTKTSDLTNDSGFITASSLPTRTSQLTNDSGFITSGDIPTIPTKTSDLTNDSNFVADASYVHTDNNYDATAKGIVDGATAAIAAKSTVAWNQIDTTGTKIAEITIDGVKTDVKATGGGGSADAYKTIDAGGQSFVASGADTFKINAGSNVTITPLTGDKGIQISAAGGGTSTGDMLMADYDPSGTVKSSTNGIEGYVANAISGKADTSSLATVATTGAYSDLSGKPTLATVATSGSYNDLSNKPTIPAAVAAKGDAETTYRTGNVNLTKANIGLGNVGNFKAVSTVASQGLSDTEKSNARANIGAGTSSFSGSYNDLSNKPTIPTVNNGQLTIQQNGANKATFTANQSGNATANIITDTWTETKTVSSSGTVSFSGLNDSYGYKIYYTLPSGDSAYTFSKVTKSGSGTSVTLTFTTDAPSGTVCKLRILK